MQVFRVGAPGAVEGIGAPPPRHPRIAVSAGDSESDRADLSEPGRVRSRLRDIPEGRFDLINRLRGEIGRGTYETGDKLRIAADRFLDELDSR